MEHDMAKGQQRSNREKKKPKAAKKEAAPAAPRFSQTVEKLKKGVGSQHRG
jgi:hypothetical protein